MLKAKRLTLDDLDFRVSAEMEYISPEQSMKGSTPEEVKNFCDAVKEVRKKATGAWGWCCVKVTGVLKGDMAYDLNDGNGAFAASDYLGCCSYENKQHFIEESGYYDDMCKNILAEVQKQLDGQVNLINESISRGTLIDSDVL